MSWIFYAIGAALFASLVAIFGKLGVKDLDSTLATSVRAVVMAGFLLIVSSFLGKWQLLGTINNKALLFIVLSGVAGALSWLMYFFALSRGPAPGVAALDRLSVVFVLILAILFFKEGFNWQNILGAALLTVGAVLMVIK